MGRGVAVGNGTGVGKEGWVGKSVAVGNGVWVGVGVAVGNWVWVGRGVAVGNQVWVGAGVTVGKAVLVLVGVGVRVGKTICRRGRTGVVVRSVKRSTNPETRPRMVLEVGVALGRRGGDWRGGAAVTLARLARTKSTGSVLKVGKTATL